MSLLRDLNRSSALRTLDDALANTLRRLDPDTPDTVLAAAALASLALAQGHAAFDPAHPRRCVDADLPWPEAEAWRRQLAESRFVATPASPYEQAAAAPLVLEHGLLYLRRYREYERRLALGLRRIAATAPGGGGSEPLAPLFARLFPDAASGDAQARAAALALRRNLLLVTGGPGTGKTTTITRLLLLRIAQAMRAGQSPPRIALAAPTGRAADRMAESLRRALQPLRAVAEVDAAWLEAMPEAAQTLHRLLGVVPDSPDFRHHAGNPLPFAVVVVDEASMVDLPLMCKLVEAVADGAQLILLGDPDQLPSVEAGDVLAGILHAAGAGDVLSADDAQALQPLLGSSPALAGAARRGGLGRGDLPGVDAGVGALHGHRVHLHRGWRQSDALDLAPLAAAVRRGDAVETLALLRGGELSNIRFHENADDPLQASPPLFEHWRALASQADPVAALAQAGQLRLLTAVREGPQGARGLNERIAAHLSGRRIGSPPTWFPGRLLLVTENSYRHGLFNGDVGVCLPDASGALLAWFPGGGEGVRGFHPAALPAHESAFAMTVHKAQGSEFETVMLQLPARDAQVLSRELLYTGITRAKQALHIAGSAGVIAAALGRHAGRVSGLEWRLARAIEPETLSG